MPAGLNSTPNPGPSPPPQSEAAPRFSNGLVPEAAPRSRGFLVFGLLVGIIVGVVLLRVLSRGTPFLLVGGVYFPAWFSAGDIGASLAMVTVIALRSLPVTRTAGTGLVFFNFAVIYAFLAWLFLFA